MDPKPKTIAVFLVFWVCWGGLGGYPQGGLGPQAGTFQEPATEGHANFHEKLSLPAEGSGAPGLLGWSEGASCLSCLVSGRAAAQAARTHNPTVIHFSSVLL